MRRAAENANAPQDSNERPALGLLSGDSAALFEASELLEGLLSGEIDECAAVAPLSEEEEEEQAQPPADDVCATGANQPGVEDALAYLDKVKRQFKDRPDVYDQFLEIMKMFKSQTIDTPAVIERVCELFCGHNNLILGFNTFLPPGSKIELPADALAVVPTSAQPQQQQEEEQQPEAASPLQAPCASASDTATPDDPRVAAQVVPGDDASEGTEQEQTDDFDYAVNYVTKVKERFTAEADSYKRFLDILHSYQTEQRSIKEVLEQVSTLFMDHPDLLREFAHFLPGAVRESAKMELQRRAAPSARRGNEETLPLLEQGASPVRPGRAWSDEAHVIRQKATQVRRNSEACPRAPDGDVSAPAIFVMVKYREVEQQPKALCASVTRCLKGTLSRKGKGKDGGGLNRRFFSDKAWGTCAVIIQGIRLEYFKKLSEGPGGALVGDIKLGSIKLDPEVTAMEEVRGPTPDETMFKFTVKRGGLTIFMLVGESETTTLRHVYWDAVQRFQDEKQLAHKFYRGDLKKFNTEEVWQAREWYHQGIITREDFDVLLAEQITTDADKLAAAVARYGEDGVPDFAVKCEDCGEKHYFLPMDYATNLTYCSECGAPLPSMDPLEEAADALAYRLRIDEDRVGFLTAVATPDGLLVVAPRDVEEVYDPERLERTFRFSFDGKLYRANDAAASRVMDAFSFGGSWSEWEQFHKALADPVDGQRETLPDKHRSLVPAFPEYAAHGRDSSRRAQKRLVRIEAFLLELLPASEKMKGFWDLRFVRKMFNLPVPADALARAPAGVLDAEGLGAGTVLADELTALKLSGATWIDKEKQSLGAGRDSVAATADISAALSAKRLADMSGEEVQQHVQRAADLLEQVDDLLSD